MQKKSKVFYSFNELAQHVRFEDSKNKGGAKPRKLAPAPKQPALTSHEKVVTRRTRQQPAPSELS
jgi:hypothetical protein